VREVAITLAIVVLVHGVGVMTGGNVKLGMVVIVVRVLVVGSGVVGSVAVVVVGSGVVGSLDVVVVVLVVSEVAWSEGSMWS